MNINSLKKKCGICINRNETLISLNILDHDGISYYRKLKLCFPEIIFDKVLISKFICGLCCVNLKNSYEFRKLFMKSLKILSALPTAKHVNVSLFEKQSAFHNDHAYLCKPNDEAYFKVSGHVLPSEQVLGELGSVKAEPLDECYDISDEIEKDSMSNNAACSPKNMTCDSPFITDLYKLHNYNEGYDEILEEIVVTDFLNTGDILQNNPIRDKPTSDLVKKECVPAIKKEVLDSGDDPLRLEDNDLSSFVQNPEENEISVKKEIFEIDETLTPFPSETHAVSKEYIEYENICNNYSENSIPNTTDMISSSLDKYILFSTVKEGEKYIPIYMQNKTVVCQDCSRTFINLNAVNSPQHEPRKPFQCEDCSKKQNLSSSLQVQKRILAKNEPCLIKSCKNKMFSTCVHKMKYRHGKPYKCLDCGKGFVRPCELNVHKRKHTGDKPYQCQVCDKKFVTNRNLSVHRMMHAYKSPILTNDTKLQKELSKKSISA